MTAKLITIGIGLVVIAYLASSIFAKGMDLINQHADKLNLIP